MRGANGPYSDPDPAATAAAEERAHARHWARKAREYREEAAKLLELAHQHEGRTREPGTLADDPPKPTRLEIAMAALGAHVQANAYANSFPDDAEDLADNRRQESYWRNVADRWAGEAFLNECAQAAKDRIYPEIADQLSGLV